MRRRRNWSRSFAGAMILWFGLVMAAPAVLHSCPQAMAGAAGSAGAEHSGHGAHDTGHDTPDQPTQCQCLGSCAVSPMAAVPGATAAFVAAAAPVSSDTRLASTHAAPALRRDHAQPLATAPPLDLG